MKYAAGIEYDGTCFYGWQTQAHVRNVQDCIESAFSKVADASIKITCAGRTDAGVHAIEQIVHFKTEVCRALPEWHNGANANLPEDVAVLWVKPVDDDFHARFSARRRCYRYVILNRPIRSALHRHTSAWVCRQMDEDAMHRAAQVFLGEHDFSSFRAAGCQSRSPVRSVLSIKVSRNGEFVEITVYADAFLQHMVRNIAGVLIAIGTGEKPESWAREVLMSCDRTQGGVTADSCGLYMLGIEYDEKYGIQSNLPQEDSSKRKIKE